jgi:hypothetical protein
MQAQRLQAAKDLVGRSRALPWRIEILDTHQPRAVMRARVEVAADGCNQGAEMKLARGGGREAPAVWGRVLTRRLAAALTRPLADLSR